MENLKKRKELLIPFIIFIIISIIYFILVITNYNAENLEVDDLFIPFPGPFTTDLIIIGILAPIYILFIGLFIAPIIALGLLYLHKIILRNKDIQRGFIYMTKDIKSSEIFKRALFPALFIFNMGMFLADKLGEGGLVEKFMGLEYNHEIGLMLFLWLPAILIFAPIWILSDSGLVVYKPSKNNRDFPEYKGLSSQFATIIQGFIGITTFLVIGEFIAEEFIYGDVTSFDDILFIFSLIFTWLFLYMSFIPLLIIYELHLAKRKEKFIKKCQKLGIVEIIELELKPRPLKDINELLK